jgi:acyl-CoA reductase-like NAD-dependent aldehyde dehydrogenase/choline dehydrogenase-like flavoprotein
MEGATATRADGDGGGPHEPIAVENPASGKTVATLPALDADAVAAMVAAAREAQPGWAKLGFERRGELLMAARGWMVANGERVVETICAETGRPADESQFAELAYGIGALEFWAKRAPAYLADEPVETASPFVRGRRLLVRYAPVGVVGVIGPWNYPLNNSFGDCIPALAAGNAVVLKPSEVTPLTSLLMAEMLGEVGVPENVFQVATGRGETGEALVDAVDHVMFTGSIATGKKVMAKAAERLTPVSLELGGKDPMVVLADADLERAANAAAYYGLANSGQICIAVERIYVEESVHDEFVAKLTEKVGALRQGPPGPPGSVDVGAIIFEPQLELIESHVRDAVERGAEVVVGGSRGEGPGRFYQPTVLTGVDHSMRCMREETFGPTLPVMKVADVEEAVALANDGPYGLQASVWTRDTDRGEELARRIEAGSVCVNDAQLNYVAMELPMGGWKDSGLGTRHGADGIRKYTKRQSLLITPGTAPPREAHMFPYRAEVTGQVGETMAALVASELFDDVQRRTLTVLCDTLVPSLEPPEHEADPTGFWRRAASHISVPEGIEIGLLEAQPPEEVIAGLRGLLDSLAEHGMSPEAPQEAREALIQGFSDSGPEALAGIHTLRGLALSLTYALPDLGTGINLNWPAMQYPGPQALPKPTDRPISPLVPDSGELTLEADVVIVGSGAGGGVIAGELATAGKRVCVLEMGGYYDESDFLGYELTGYRQLYLNGGPFPTVDGQVGIQAGSSLGGGTVLNWTNCLRTHPWVREEWAREHGLEGLDGSDFDTDLDAVLERIEANDRCSDLNGPHRKLEAACQARGLEFARTVRNTDPGSYDPVTAGYMGFGDQSGSKRSTQKTYLADAAERDAEFVVGCRVERILTEDGRASGVEGTWTGEDGRTARVVVRAPTVVVAGGSVESPALLLRSGIGGPAVGEYLRLHPTSAIFGNYGEPLDPWWGPPQAGLTHAFADLSDGYGYLVECPHHTTGLYAAAVPWRSARQHKEEMLKLRHGAAFINLTRDRGHGRVSIDEQGRAVCHYPLADELDVANLRAGLEEMIRMHEAAGAEEIHSLGRKAPVWRRGEDLEAFVEEIGATSLAPREMAIFSAHQMGSCRMGTDPATSVAGPWGELHDTPGVWMGDASAFPTASGTNPMLTIMALARRTARAIAAA